MIAVALNIHVAIAAHRFGTRSCGSNFQLQAKRNIVAARCRPKQTLTRSGLNPGDEFKGACNGIGRGKDRYRLATIYRHLEKKTGSLRFFIFQRIITRVIIHRKKRFRNEDFFLINIGANEGPLKDPLRGPFLLWRFETLKCAERGCQSSIRS